MDGQDGFPGPQDGCWQHSLDPTLDWPIPPDPLVQPFADAELSHHSTSSICPPSHDERHPTNFSVASSTLNVHHCNDSPIFVDQTQSYNSAAGTGYQEIQPGLAGVTLNSSSIPLDSTYSYAVTNGSSPVHGPIYFPQNHFRPPSSTVQSHHSGSWMFVDQPESYNAAIGTRYQGIQPELAGVTLNSSFVPVGSTYSHAVTNGSSPVRGTFYYPSNHFPPSSSTVQSHYNGSSAFVHQPQSYNSAMRTHYQKIQPELAGVTLNSSSIPSDSAYYYAVTNGSSPVHGPFYSPPIHFSLPSSTVQSHYNDSWVFVGQTESYNPAMGIGYQEIRPELAGVTPTSSSVPSGSAYSYAVTKSFSPVHDAFYSPPTHFSPPSSAVQSDYNGSSIFVDQTRSYESAVGTRHQEDAPIYFADQTTGAAEAATSNNLYWCEWLAGGVLCGHSFITFDELIVHLRNVHDVQGSADRRLACGWRTHTGSCGNEYRRDAFHRHIKTHLKFSIPCNHCKKSFSRVDTLRLHMKKEHKQELLSTVPA